MKFLCALRGERLTLANSLFYPAGRYSALARWLQTREFAGMLESCGIRHNEMANLSSTIACDFCRYYQQVAEQIHKLVEPLSTSQLWRRPYPYGNSIGHLLLHLTGNLSYYIGAEIARTGYVRNRPLEFSDPSYPAKEVVLKNFDAAIAMVVATLEKQSEADWDTAYNSKGWEDAGDRFTVFLRCAAHASQHMGQIIYLCKEIARQPEHHVPSA